MDRAGEPIAGLDDRLLAAFDRGDELFEVAFREADGLGPLYIRSSCAACHRGDGRGPGMVGRMAVVDPDGVTRAKDQSPLAFGDTERPYLAAGAKRALLAPSPSQLLLAEHGRRRILSTQRLPPPVWGRGYLDAVADDEIRRVAAAAGARTDGIRGRINAVAGRGGALRFGLKARAATLDDFTADALQGDMGITSPARPSELPNPDGLTDDARPGVDASAEIVKAIADYVRLLAIPERKHGSARGRALFAEASCAACHVPALRTRADHPVKALAGIDAPVYTDMLVHDMGTALADAVEEGAAGGREWRTAPLMGLRFARAFMHDGRAGTVDEAIAAHEGPGSEANGSVKRFRALAAADRAELLRFVGGL